MWNEGSVRLVPAFILLLGSVALPSNAALPIILKAVTVHLFLENSGQLSADVLSMSAVYAVNGNVGPEVGNFPENSNLTAS